MQIGIPREVYPGERRVAATPESVAQLIKLGFSVVVESDAGLEANIGDDVYREAGAEVVAGPREVWEAADILLKVRAPMRHPTLGCQEAELLGAGKTLVSFIWPAQNPDLMQELAATQGTVLAMDSV
ncbi:MAG: NAD(P)(+) transhydrogenase (Re/Si-specific) subunit alpha, partial [Chromatiaceae bacterium]